MVTPTLLLLMLALDNPKIAATLAEAPGPKIVCDGTAEVPDGIVLNVELFISTQAEKLLHLQVRVKDGAFAAAFTPFRGRERNLPGRYSVKVHYHGAFQPKPLENVDPFFVEAKAVFGTPAEIEAAHKAVRDRIIADLNGFKTVADDVQAAFDASKGKPDPKDWRKRVEGWKKACTDIEDRAAVDPDFKALGFGRVTQTSMEYLREKIRGMVEHGGAGRASDFQLGREQLDGMIRAIIIEIAPGGIDDRRPPPAHRPGPRRPHRRARGRRPRLRRHAPRVHRGRLPAQPEGLRAGPGDPAPDRRGRRRVLRHRRRQPRLRKPLVAPLDKKLDDALRELTKTE